MSDRSSRSLKFWVPLLPKIMKTGLLHVLKRSEQSKYWDFRTAITIRILDIVINELPPNSVTNTQSRTLKDPGIKGNVWISKVKLPSPPEDSIRQVLFNTIEKLKKPEEAIGGYTEPELLPVEGEWTGYRANASAKAPELKISEEKKYEEMMREVTSKITILYIHGGALYLGDPITHRNVNQKLAKHTGGRTFSVRYRLAPKHPFPAALLDVLFAYLSLLYPPPGSLHTPVSPSDIVIAGDSAGGNLSFALLQLILELQRSSLKIKWYGEERDVPIPAGVATSSPWLDITSSMPSIKNNQPYDFLPKHEMEYKKCSIWPADPPRKHMYVNDPLCAHPLVSPLVAKNWNGSCPIYIATGWEILADEEKISAMNIASQGVKVIFEEYEAMPHCFGLVLPKLPGSDLFFQNWARNIKLMVDHPNDLVTNGTLIKAKTLATESLDVLGLSSLTYEKAVEIINEKISQSNTKSS
ncbi:hypothetical protein EPUL_000410 [Erysiphe pulchra]|uniref:Alpha/beta hydrolase fold-3 domain-containing protein n=1 Tax=Erysiphe pulchra TaxID=225359 RepID=A0A2S4Q0V8_9PEZI|nr:hypothetical protein EPUL_000410 [Erysiphe pulchra]